MWGCLLNSKWSYRWKCWQRGRRQGRRPSGKLCWRSRLWCGWSWWRCVAVAVALALATTANINLFGFPLWFWFCLLLLFLAAAGGLRGTEGADPDMATSDDFLLKCNAEKTQAACLALGCDWCVAHAVPSTCLDPAHAKQINGTGVFTCHGNNDVTRF